GGQRQPYRGRSWRNDAPTTGYALSAIPALVPQDPICYSNRALSGREVLQGFSSDPMSMIPKSGNRFSDKIVLKQNYAAMAELVDALA
ncbi:MAG: hypothetical protein ABSF41_08540, partial [Pseudolabrys sp.]